jgi:hypothetical protein
VTQQPHLPAKLLAIIEVSPSEKVRCGRPGCKHTVYKAVHVVRDAGQLMVLGSTCFAKRYGGAQALGPAQHWGAAGKALTPEERALLDSNTEALLQRLADEEQKVMQEAAAKLKALQERLASRHISPQPSPMRPAYAGPIAPRRSPPWTWAAGGSIAAFLLRDGTGWVRVQHRDGRQCIAPWPAFDGWDEFLPPSVGVADQDLGAYVAADVAAAVSYLRVRAASEKITGIWAEAAAILPKAGAAPG